MVPPTLVGRDGWDQKKTAENTKWNVMSPTICWQMPDLKLTCWVRQHVDEFRVQHACRSLCWKSKKISLKYRLKRNTRCGQTSLNHGCIARVRLCVQCLLTSLLYTRTHGYMDLLVTSCWWNCCCCCCLHSVVDVLMGVEPSCLQVSVECFCWYVFGENVCWILVGVLYAVLLRVPPCSGIKPSACCLLLLLGDAPGKAELRYHVKSQGSSAELLWQCCTSCAGVGSFCLCGGCAHVCIVVPILDRWLRPAGNRNMLCRSTWQFDICNGLRVDNMYNVVLIILYNIISYQFILYCIISYCYCISGL